MSERRAGLGPRPRTDEQILEHTEDVELLRAIAHGHMTVQSDNRMDLRRLARENLCLARGFHRDGVPVT